MTIWLIDPHEPLIFREGKPFEATPGAHAKSLPFPFPSTTAGALRTQSHLNENGVFEEPTDKDERNKLLNDLKAISVRGPLLVSLEPDGETIEQWLIPAPADALLLNVKETDEDKLEEKDNEDKKENKEEKAVVRQLLPLNIEKDKVFTDFTARQSDEQEALQVVGLPLNEDDSSPEKPHKKAPRYWYWSAFEQWLRSPGPSSQRSIAKLGTSGPMQEIRVHVAMDHDTRAGKEGRLFDTSGLEFTHIKAPSDKEPVKLSTASANRTAACEAAPPDAVEKPEGPDATAPSSEADVPSRLNGAQRLALALITDDERDNDEQNKSDRQVVKIANRLGTLGGERRLVTWRKSTSKLPYSPKGLEELKELIKKDKRCRLFLLTPAYFSQGYRPTRLCQQHETGVRPKLRAIAIQRPQVVSGWDLAEKKAKPSRRLAPAGTVLFLELEGDKDAIGKWVEKTWFSCISDDVNNPKEDPAQYRRDGFGLAVLGAWPIETY